MGLAPYGEPRYLDNIKNIFGSSYQDLSTHDLNIFSKKLISESLINELGFGQREENSLSIDRKYADLAASAQTFLEEIVDTLIKESIIKYEISMGSSLYLGGGVSLNCKLNHRISHNFSDRFKVINIFPAGGDGGSSYGSCYHYLNTYKRLEPRNTNFSILSGTNIENVREECKCKGIRYHELDSNSLKKIILLLKSGEIGGISRDRAEFGPRALGNRSIIADPCNKTHCIL